MSIIATLLGLYAASVVAVAWWARDDDDESASFAIGARSVGRFSTVASLAAGFRDGAGIAAWITLSAYYGLGALWLALGLGAGVVLLSLGASRVRDEAARLGAISLSELLGARFGLSTGRFAGVLIVGTSFLVAAVQLNVAARLLATVADVQTIVGIVAVSVLVGAYLMLGGYRAVISTDRLQWLVISLILFVPFLLSDDLEWSNLPGTFTSPGFHDGAAFFMLSFLVAFTGADVWQRVFSARTGADARAALSITAPTYLLLSLFVVLFGVGLATLLGQETKEPLFDLFRTDAVPELVQSLVALFLISSIMSTVDTQAFVFASTLDRLTPAASWTLRPIIGATVVSLAVASAFVGDIVEFLFGAVSLATILFPLCVVAAFDLSAFRPSDKGTVLALVVATLVYIPMFVNGYFSSISMTLVPAAVSSSAFLALSLILGGRSEAHSE